MNLSMLDFVHVDDREIFMRQMRINQKGESAALNEEGQANTVPEYVSMGMTAEMFKRKIIFFYVVLQFSSSICYAILRLFV